MLVSASAVWKLFAASVEGSQLARIQDFDYNEINFKPDQLHEALWALHGMSFACAHIIHLFVHPNTFGVATY